MDKSVEEIQNENDSHTLSILSAAESERKRLQAEDAASRLAELGLWKKRHVFLRTTIFLSKFGFGLLLLTSFVVWVTHFPMKVYEGHLSSKFFEAASSIHNMVWLYSGIVMWMGVADLGSKKSLVSKIGLGLICLISGLFLFETYPENGDFKMRVFFWCIGLLMAMGAFYVLGLWDEKEKSALSEKPW